MDVSQKFDKILQNFLQSNYRAANDVYLEMLLSHLSGKNGEDYSALLKSPFIMSWIEKCLDILEVDPLKLSPKVVSFMLKLSALLIEDEWLMFALRDKRLAYRIHDYLWRNQETFTPTVKWGHVHFLMSVNRYSLGLGWIKQTGSWRSLVTYCQRNQTVYVVREAVKLIYEILYNFSVKINDEEQCIEMLMEITKPLSDSVFDEDAITVYVDDSELQQKLTPTLYMIEYILTKTLESETKTKIAYYLDTKFKLNINLWKLASMTQNEQFMLRIFKTYTCYNYAQLVYEKWTSGCIPSAEFNQFGVNFFNVMKFCIGTKSCNNVRKLAELNHVLWKKLGARAPEEILIENECIVFENQLITYHLLPVMFIFRHQMSQEEELFDNYIMKLFALSCEFTLRACYSFRDLLYDFADVVADIAYKSIHGILAMEKILHRDRAVLVFQAMAYALKEFAIEGTACASPKADTDLLVKKPNLLSAVLIGLHTLIHRYHITWKESIESTYLLNFVMALLHNPNITPMLTVQALKLTQLSIEHFLSPNLALLVDNFHGSALQNLGPMIMKRLHDNSWEVRDSTIELVTSMTSISCLKFPAFQQYILDSGICPIIWSISKNDTEPYVRASALKCLNEMAVINLLWENCLCQYNMLDHLLKTACVESEGIVRKEAILLVCRIYSKRKVPSNYLDCMLSTLSYCTVSDLHWEVKLNALSFWKVIIYEHFENQGMIDGTFPTVTFSKEKKKIVTLTTKEILLRIERILNELSDRGCLGVFLECLNDTCDLEVTKRAVLITKRLCQCMEKYEFLDYFLPKYESNSHSPMEAEDSPKISQNEATETNSKETPCTKSDRIIEAIVSAQDINLLAEAYENQLQVNDDSTPVNRVESNLYKKYARVKPIDFLRKLQSIDLDALIKEKSDWIMQAESFESLLDDMLYSIKTVEVNDADCY